MRVTVLSMLQSIFDSKLVEKLYSLDGNTELLTMLRNCDSLGHKSEELSSPLFVVLVFTIGMCCGFIRCEVGESKRREMVVEGATNDKFFWL